MYRGSALRRCSHALHSASHARRTATQGQRASLSSDTRLRYIPLKVKEEMLALHDEDGSRWTATTLSARFSAPRENVEAILKLRRFRAPESVGGREKRSADEQKELEIMREQMVNAWKQVPEVTERSGYRRGNQSLAKPSVLPKGEAAAVAAQEGEVDAKEKEVGDAEEKKVVEKSKTAKWIEETCEKAALDVKRRTTFAFIEVGNSRDEEVERAVWMREGGTGKLRVANEMERKVLLQQVRVVDSGLWK